MMKFIGGMEEAKFMSVVLSVSNEKCQRSFDGLDP